MFYFLSGSSNFFKYFCVEPHLFRTRCESGVRLGIGRDGALTAILYNIEELMVGSMNAMSPEAVAMNLSPNQHPAMVDNWYKLMIDCFVFSK